MLLMSNSIRKHSSVRQKKIQGGEAGILPVSGDPGVGGVIGSNSCGEGGRACGSHCEDR